MGWNLAVRSLYKGYLRWKACTAGTWDISAVYNYQPDSIYELAAAEIAAQGCRVFMYSESMHYDGTLDHTEAQKVGKAYREVEKFEKYLTDRKHYADIAIVQSDVADTLHVTQPIQIRCVGRALVSGMHRQALLGAMQLCDYSKRSWCVVPELEMDFARMCEYKMILLPDLFYISDRLAAICAVMWKMVEKCCFPVRVVCMTVPGKCCRILHWQILWGVI